MITVVATMHNEIDNAKMFIGCLLSQTNSDWKCIIYHNGPNPRLSELETLIDDRFIIKYSDIDTGNWGTHNRNEAIKLCTTSHIIQTSIQDYYVPTAIQELSQYLDKDFIYFNSINHLFGYHGILNCEPIPGFIDWGNFAIRTSIAKNVGIRHPKEFRADGLFVKDCIDSGLIKTTVKISKILTIHN